MIKAIIGYNIVPGITHEEYDQWLWQIHVPDILANPYIEKIVFNTVLQPVERTSSDAARVENGMTFYRIAEMHFQSFEAYEAYRAWFKTHPIPIERGPKGRTDFKFYLLCEVVEVSR